MGNQCFSEKKSAYSKSIPPRVQHSLGILQKDSDVKLARRIKTATTYGSVNSSGLFPKYQFDFMQNRQVKSEIMCSQEIFAYKAPKFQTEILFHEDGFLDNNQYESKLKTENAPPYLRSINQP